jgi:hypothetical protein
MVIEIDNTHQSAASMMIDLISWGGVKKFQLL